MPALRTFAIKSRTAIAQGLTALKEYWTASAAPALAAGFASVRTTVKSRIIYPLLARVSSLKTELLNRLAAFSRTLQITSTLHGPLTIRVITLVE